jgi:hypothetical protein
MKSEWWILMGSYGMWRWSNSNGCGCGNVDDVMNECEYDGWDGMDEDGSSTCLHI